MKALARKSLVVVALSAAVGVSVPSLSNIVVAGVFAVLCIVILGGAIRRHIVDAGRFTRMQLLPARRVVRDRRFTGSRACLYAGLLTSCWLQVRFHGVTLSDALFLLALGMAVLEWSATRYQGVPLISEPLRLGVLLFVAGGCASTLVESHSRTASLGVILRVLYLIVAWLWVGAISLRTPQHVRTAMKCWVVSAAICGAWTLGQKYGHLPGNTAHGRYAGLADHVNDLGALSACALVPGLMLAYRSRAWGIAVVGIVVGLIMSQSIGAGIAAMLALAFGLWSRELAKPTLIGLAVGAAIVLLASPFLGGSAITRFATATNPNALYGQDTLGSRERIYVAAWHYIEHSPLIGRGFDAVNSSIYDPVTGSSFQVHNLFLGTWYEGGILSLVGILLMIYAFGRTAWRNVLSDVDRLASLAAMAGFVAYVVDELSEPSLYKRYSLVPVLLAVALRRIRVKGARAPVRSVSSPRASSTRATTVELT